MVDQKIIDVNNNNISQYPPTCFLNPKNEGYKIKQKWLKKRFSEGMKIKLLYVEKEGKTLYYEGPLIYAALFSTPEVYECNVKRLMLRLASLCSIYRDKIKILQKRECNSLLDIHLSELAGLADNLESSEQLLVVKTKAEEIEIINNVECPIF